MLETINYNKVEPVIKWAQIYYKIYLFSIKTENSEKSCLEDIFD